MHGAGIIYRNKFKIVKFPFVAATACLPAVFLAGPENISKYYREVVADVSSSPLQKVD